MSTKLNDRQDESSRTKDQAVRWPDLRTLGYALRIAPLSANRLPEFQSSEGQSFLAQNVTSINLGWGLFIEFLDGKDIESSLLNGNADFLPINNESISGFLRVSDDPRFSIRDIKAWLMVPPSASISVSESLFAEHELKDEQMLSVLRARHKDLCSSFFKEIAQNSLSQAQGDETKNGLQGEPSGQEGDETEKTEKTRQSNRSAHQIQDAGQYIPGARKDYHKRSLTLTEAQSLDLVEKMKVVKKDNIWSLVSPDEAKEQGFGPSGYFALRKIRSLVSQVPVLGRHITSMELDEPAVYDRYVEVLEAFRKNLESRYPFRDTLEAEQALYDTINDLGWGEINFTWQDQTAESSVSELQKLGLNYLYPTRGRYEYWGGRATPKTQDSWFFFTAIAPKLQSCLFDMKFNSTVRYPIRNSVKKSQYSDSNVLENPGVLWDVLFASKRNKFQESNEAGHSEENASTNGANDPSKKTRLSHSESLDQLSYIGPDYTRGKDITETELIEEFGFNGVQFGNSIPNIERQKHVNRAYNSFCMLAEILKVPNRAIGMNKTANLAFGSQGIPNARAHFSPGINLVHLSRKSGAGSLAHEMAHFYDYAISQNLIVNLQESSDSRNHIQRSGKFYLSEFATTRQRVGRNSYYVPHDVHSYSSSLAPAIGALSTINRVESMKEQLARISESIAELEKQSNENGLQSEQIDPSEDESIEQKIKRKQEGLTYIERDLKRNQEAVQNLPEGTAHLIDQSLKMAESIQSLFTGPYAVGTAIADLKSAGYSVELKIRDFLSKHVVVPDLVAKKQINNPDNLSPYYLEQQLDGSEIRSEIDRHLKNLLSLPQENLKKSIDFISTSERLGEILLEKVSLLRQIEHSLEKAKSIDEPSYIPFSSSKLQALFDEEGVTHLLKRRGYRFVTNFSEASKSLDKAKGGSYYSLPYEMLARSFESWLDQQLTKRGWVNEYLIKETQVYASSKLYPQGEQKQAVLYAVGQVADCIANAALLTLPEAARVRLEGQSTGLPMLHLASKDIEAANEQLEVTSNDPGDDPGDDSESDLDSEQNTDTLNSAPAG